MQYRSLGRSGLKVPELCFGTGTFGGTNDFSKAWGSTQDAEAARRNHHPFFPNSNPTQLFFRTQTALDEAATKLGLSRDFPEVVRRP